MYLDKTTGLTLPGAGGASGGGTDTSDATAKPEDVAEGAVFYNADGKQTGTLPDVEVTDYGDNYNFTFSPGILRKETHIRIMKYADDDEFIPDDGPEGEDNYFLLNDPDLRPKNIRKGVSVFGVTGNLEPGTAFYKCASVDADNKTWTGYKAVLADGVYSFEETLTEGLTYGSALRPAVDGIYDEFSRIQIAKLYQGSPVPKDGLVFFDALSSLDGWSLSRAQIVEDTERNVCNIPTSNAYAVLEINPGVPLGSSPRTMSFWYKRNEFIKMSWFYGIGYGTTGDNHRFTASMTNTYAGILLGNNDYTSTGSGAMIPDNTWCHLVYTYDGVDTVTAYLNNKKVWTRNMGTIDTQWEHIHIGDPNSGVGCTGRYADLCIYDRVLDESEIQNLYEARTV